MLGWVERLPEIPMVDRLDWEVKSLLEEAIPLVLLPRKLRGCVHEISRSQAWLEREINFISCACCKTFSSHIQKATKKIGLWDCLEE